jgi:starch synthase (maltosyl-transferring)
MRLALAATLAPSYGIYSGFELCENAGVEGREEYLHSEKYEIKHRDWYATGNIVNFITVVNVARRENPALLRLDNLRFLDVDNGQLIAYVKRLDTNVIIVVVNLDPHVAHTGMLEVPPDAVGIPGESPYTVHDLVTGARYSWRSGRNYVFLDPVGGEPVHIFRVVPQP